jgi:hypothetical protein
MYLIGDWYSSRARLIRVIGLSQSCQNPFSARGLIAYLLPLIVKAQSQFCIIVVVLQVLEKWSIDSDNIF